MYYRYFGLTEAPFSIAVNPRYLFMSARHRDALAHLLYGVGEGGGFVLLTGEVGTGKTTIIRSLLEQLPDNIDLAMVFNPALEADELLASVCDELGIPRYGDKQPSRKMLTDVIHGFLLENHAKGRNTVLLIDEAQHLKFEVLEQIRLLTNLETNTKKLLQIILVGQPELRDILNRPELRQLAQRITARYQLKPLNLQETDDYIRHRLQVAGLPANQRLFPKSIVKAIHRSSRGIPRIINVLCDRMLLGAYGKNKSQVDKAMYRQALAEVAGEEADVKRNADYWPLSLALLAALGLSIVAALLLQQYGLWPTNDPKADQALKHSQQQNSGVVQREDFQEIAKNNSMISSRYWFSKDAPALAALLKVYGVKDVNQQACFKPGWRCEQLQLDSWEELASFNRPMIIQQLTAAKLQRYVLVFGVDDEQALVHYGDEQLVLSLEKLGATWTGETILLWQPPQDYTGPISRGSTDRLVAWISEQFAQLDGQKEPLASDRFNANLEQRVKLFQRSQELEADGVVGLHTLLKLQELLAKPVTLTPIDSWPIIDGKED